MKNLVKATALGLALVCWAGLGPYASKAYGEDVEALEKKVSKLFFKESDAKRELLKAIRARSTASDKLVGFPRKVAKTEKKLKGLKQEFKVLSMGLEAQLREAERAMDKHKKLFEDAQKKVKELEAKLKKM